MYKYIINPETNKKVNIKTKLGKNILEKYIVSLTGGSNPNPTQNMEPVFATISNDGKTRIIIIGNRAYEYKGPLGWKKIETIQ